MPEERAARPLPEKTTQMLLIEERAGREIRDVLAEAYARAGSVEGAIELIARRYGVFLGLGTFSRWVRSLGGQWYRRLLFPVPGREAGPAPGAPAPDAPPFDDLAEDPVAEVAA